MPPVEYSGTRQIFLEENYRSTGAILRASLEIISRGTPPDLEFECQSNPFCSDDARIEKSLFTSRGCGTTPTLYECDDEWREADAIAYEVKRLLAHGGGQLTYNDIAVLCKLCECTAARWCSLNPFIFVNLLSVNSTFQCHLASYRSCVS